MNDRRTAAAALALLVLAASLAPTQGAVTTGDATALGADKLLHAVGYAALTYAVARALHARTARRLTVVVFAVAAFGAGVELVQPFVGRTASALDALANLAGAALGALAWLRFHRRDWRCAR